MRQLCDLHCLIACYSLKTVSYKQRAQCPCWLSNCHLFRNQMCRIFKFIRVIVSVFWLFLWPTVIMNVIDDRVAPVLGYFLLFVLAFHTWPVRLLCAMAILSTSGIKGWCKVWVSVCLMSEEHSCNFIFLWGREMHAYRRPFPDAPYLICIQYTPSGSLELILFLVNKYCPMILLWWRHTKQRDDSWARSAQWRLGSSRRPLEQRASAFRENESLFQVHWSKCPD